MGQASAPPRIVVWLHALPGDWEVVFPHIVDHVRGEIFVAGDLEDIGSFSYPVLVFCLQDDIIHNHTRKVDIADPLHPPPAVRFCAERGRNRIGFVRDIFDSESPNKLGINGVAFHIFFFTGLIGGELKLPGEVTLQIENFDIEWAFAARLGASGFIF